MSDETNNMSLVSDDQPSISDLLQSLARYGKEDETRSPSIRVADWLLLAVLTLFLFAGICSFIWVSGGAYAGTARNAGFIAVGLTFLVGGLLFVGAAFHVLMSGVRTSRVGLAAVFAETTDKHRRAEFKLTDLLSRYPLKTLESLARRIKVEVETVTQRMALATVVGGVAVVIDKLFPGAGVSLSDTITFASAANLAALGGGIGAVGLHSVREVLKRLECAVIEAVENAKYLPQPMGEAKEMAPSAIANRSASDVVVPIQSRGERQDV